MTTWSGTLPTIAAGGKILGSDIDTIRDAVGGVTDAWDSYTPSWTGTTTNPAIGNGSIVGKYIRSGKFVCASVSITMGSTTTFGSGNWLVSLPVTAASTLPWVGVVLLFDANSSTNNRAGCAFLSTTSVLAFVADGNVGAAVPFAWQTSDVFRFSITYEAA